MKKPFVMVVHRDRKHALCIFLPNDILVEEFFYFAGLRHFCQEFGGYFLFFFVEDLAADSHAIIANIHSGTGDHLAHI